MTDEHRHSADKIDQGKDRPRRRLPLWGCLVAVAVLLLLIYAACRFAIWKGFAASASF